MALNLVNLHKQSDFIWAEDPDKDDPEKATVLQYRPLDAYEQAYLQDRVSTIESMPDMKPGDKPEDIMKNVKTRTEVHRVAVDAIRIACTGFTNVFDADTDQPVEFETEIGSISGRAKPLLKNDIVARFPIGMCLAFWMNLMQKSTVDKDTEKNSGGQSSQSKSSKTGTAAPALKTSSVSGDAEVAQN
jgi:hypothetical protein